MAFDITRSLHVIENQLLSSGIFKSNVQIGEPKAAPTALMMACIWMDRFHVASVSLTEAREIHALTVRIYRNMINDNQELIETEMATAVSKTLAALYKDFDLGDTVITVDVAGWYHKPLEVKWGYVHIGGENRLFRIADISICLIVDSDDLLAE